MRPVQPINTVHLFPLLQQELIALLRSLSDEDWHRPTAAPLWKVKDIVAHLLDTDIRRLSAQRDGFPLQPPDRPLESYRELVGFLNQLNADWIRATQRLSPRLLIEFLAQTGTELATFIASLDPHGTAPFSVAWAGEEQSQNWFDIAREYTEKWHHQQQLRDAVGAPPLYERSLFYPVLDTFMRGLPHTYRDTLSGEGRAINFMITGEAGGQWSLVRTTQRWQLSEGQSEKSAAAVELDQDTAWRLLTKGLSSANARTRVRITGDETLGAVILKMLAVMA